MKKMAMVLLVGLCFFVGFASCCNAENYEKLSTNGILRSIPVYVVTKGEIGALLAGGKITIPVGQYIVGQLGQLVNVTGMTMDDLFKVGMASYGMKVEDRQIENVSRYAESDSQTILYIFDYK